MQWIGDEDGPGASAANDEQLCRLHQDNYAADCEHYNFLVSSRVRKHGCWPSPVLLPSIGSSQKYFTRRGN
jgi:hypothetical protein